MENKECMSNLATVERYYQAINDNNVAEAEKFLHDEIQIKSPLDVMTGKEESVGSIRGFAGAIKNLTIRTKCSSVDQVMLAYDVEFPEPIGHFPSAGLISFKEGLISYIELYYDPRRITGAVEKEIFN